MRLGGSTAGQRQNKQKDEGRAMKRQIDGEEKRKGQKMKKNVENKVGA